MTVHVLLDAKTLEMFASISSVGIKKAKSTIVNNAFSVLGNIKKQDFWLIDSRHSPRYRNIATTTIVTTTMTFFIFAQSGPMDFDIKRGLD